MDTGGHLSLMPLQDDLGPSPSSPGLDQDPCFLCEGDPAWFCAKCSKIFCSGCWDMIPAHRKGLEGRRGPRARPRAPHEIMDLKAYYRLSEIFEQRYSTTEMDGLTEWEAGAKWFYVFRHPDNGDFRLGESRRFRTLTAHRWEFPSLVSFIGQTGKITS